MTVIDLGELRDETPPEPSRRPPRSVGRPVRAALALVVVLLTLTAAAAPSRRDGFTVPAAPGSTTFLVGDRLFVTEPTGPSAGQGAQLTAYAVPATGRGALAPLWQAPLPFATPYGQVGVRDGIVLFVGGRAPDGPYRTYAFGLAGGDRRWELDGAGFDVPGGLLIPGEEDRGGLSVRFVDLATGRTRWQLPVPEATTLRWDAGQVDRIVTTPPNGPAEVFDARTGSRLVSARINPDALPTLQFGHPVGDLLVVARDNATRLTAYGLDRLDRRWEARVGLADRIVRCGALICVFEQTGGLSGLDPDTGTLRWSAPLWRETLAERGGRLLVSLSGSGTGQRLAFLDTLTGRLVADVGAWEVARSYERRQRVVVTRPAGSGRVLVAELDVAAARTRVLDVLPDVVEGCVAGGELLACRRADSPEYGVWRLP